MKQYVNNHVYFTGIHTYSQSLKTLRRFPERKERDGSSKIFNSTDQTYSQLLFLSPCDFEDNLPFKQFQRDAVYSIFSLIFAYDLMFGAAVGK